jgi:hypothetical protein
VGSNRTSSHFSQVLGDPGALLVLARPERLWDAYRWLLLPSGTVAIANPISLLPAAPTVLALFFQDELLEKRYTEHWAAVILPLLGFAAADGARRLSRGALTRVLALGLVAAGTLVTYVNQSPLPGSIDHERDEFVAQDHDLDIARSLPLVPRDVPILASGTLVAYLNLRREIYVFPPTKHYAPPVWPHAQDVPVVVLDYFDRSTQTALGQRGLSPLRRDPPPVLFAPAHKILLVMNDYPRPAVAAWPNALFGENLRLDGYDVAREGEKVVLMLQWRVEHRTYFTYGRKVELLGPDGAVVASETNMPVLYLASTDDWRDGQRVIDRVELRPTGSGPYRFRVGWKMTGASESPLTVLTLSDGSRTYESPPLPLSER